MMMMGELPCNCSLEKGCAKRGCTLWDFCNYLTSCMCATNIISVALLKLPCQPYWDIYIQK